MLQCVNRRNGLVACSCIETAAGCSGVLELCWRRSTRNHSRPCQTTPRHATPFRSTPSDGGCVCCKAISIFEEFASHIISDIKKFWKCEIGNVSWIFRGAKKKLRGMCFRMRGIVKWVGRCKCKVFLPLYLLLRFPVSSHTPFEAIGTITILSQVPRNCRVKRINVFWEPGKSRFCFIFAEWRYVMKNLEIVIFLEMLNILNLRVRRA
jgi:hypothetical protein